MTDFTGAYPVQHSRKNHGEAWRRMRHFVAVASAFVIIGVILWIDIATGIWQELAVVSGLAGGLVSFLLTVTVLDRILQRQTERRWAPLNRIALSDFLHTLADDESEITPGPPAARTLPAVQSAVGTSELAEEMRRLRQTVVDERDRLARVLSSWAGFLASSGDYEAILTHTADIAWSLDRVRDATLRVDAAGASHDEVQHALDDLSDRIEQCNRSFAAVIPELRARLVADSPR
ncbi:hypothetical protein [Microbacterium sp. YY-01]|uniref:hypothetical protein n=1 Tax=Microbacterium sp. YY-01 TaxID=3421634 RepID=UPI003D17DA6B